MWLTESSSGLIKALFEGRRIMYVWYIFGYSSKIASVSFFTSVVVSGVLFSVGGEVVGEVVGVRTRSRQLVEP